MVILRSAAMLIIHAIKTRPDFATSSVSKISIFARPHARFQIACGFKNFHSGERFQKVADSHANSLIIRVDERQIRKEKVANSKISGYRVNGALDYLKHSLLEDKQTGKKTSIQ